MATTRVCKLCRRRCFPRSGWCEWHRLARQSAGAQAEAAAKRLGDHVGPMLQKAPAGLLEGDEKWCRHCQAAVPGFYTTGARCKGCASRAAHGAHVQKVYGISGAEYDGLLRMQGHRCAICRQKPVKKRLAVDHDHKTGEVRGLLCATCNKGILGSAHDSLEILQRAVDYMESPPARELARPG